MDPRKFALFGGIVMVLMGVFSLLFAGSMVELPPLMNEVSYGLFLGMFPMNIFNKVALLVIGAAGIASALAKFTALPASIRWSRAVMMVMGVLTILGLFPQTNTLGGYWPLFGGEILAHGVFALLGGYFGYALSSKVRDSGPAVRDFTSPINGTR